MKRRRIAMPRKPSVPAERRVIVIDKGCGFVKAALVVNGEPIEFADCAHGSDSLVGCVFAGKVDAVNKNGFAFINIGQERNAFLNLNDNKNAAPAGSLKVGTAVPVQVTRDAYKDKGANVTTKLTWFGRYFVIEQTGQACDTEQNISISKKITSAAERERLARVAKELLEKIPLPLADKNIILRTDAANTATSYLESELARLAGAAAATEAALKAAGDADLPALVYKPYSSACVMMTARLMSGGAVQEIIVNDERERDLIAEEVGSRGVTVSLHGGSTFLAHGISKTYDTTKAGMVYLPSGGRIFIDRTEACVVIDVNSGKFSEKKSHEDMALKINTEAARETAKQLRLRNLGGMVIIDFIRMKDQENNHKLLNELRGELAKDPAITIVEGFTRLGLVEMTRKRR